MISHTCSLESITCSNVNLQALDGVGDGPERQPEWRDVGLDGWLSTQKHPFCSWCGMVVRSAGSGAPLAGLSPSFWTWVTCLSSWCLSVFIKWESLYLLHKIVVVMIKLVNTYRPVAGTYYRKGSIISSNCQDDDAHIPRRGKKKNKSAYYVLWSPHLISVS